MRRRLVWGFRPRAGRSVASETALMLLVGLVLPFDEPAQAIATGPGGVFVGGAKGVPGVGGAYSLR